jgi:hypothetical protein
MNSDHRITMVSPADVPAIHSYFDLPPESPDGSRVVYFAFLEGPPGLGRVTVAARDGGRARAFDPPVSGSAHHAVLQQWIDDDSIAYSVMTDQGPATEVVTLGDGGRRRLDRSIRMFSPASGMGLCDVSAARALGLAAEEAIHLVNPRSGEVRRLFTRDEVFAAHPWRDTFSDLEHVHFQNSKWSPDGARFFTVYTNESYLRAGGEATRMKSLIVGDAADGYRPRYLAEFGHHPMWAHDGSFVYAYTRPAEGGQDLTAFPLDGSAPRTLAAKVPGIHATLSPDGRSALTDAFGRPEPGMACVLLLDLASGSARELVTMKAPDTTHGTGCHLHPVWSRDGGRVYFNSNDSGVSHLYALDL